MAVLKGTVDEQKVDQCRGMFVERWCSQPLTALVLCLGPGEAQRGCLVDSVWLKRPATSPSINLRSL
jgi:hypothetical protein